MLAAGHRFRAGLRRIAGGLLGGLWALGLLAGAAGANPTGAQVRHGAIQIAPGVHMDIHQGTERAIIDWQSFSIGAHESVRILQPGELSVLLNRVVGQDPSMILGQLQSNGTVFLINPNGILFGPDSTVNVGSLVASSLDLSDRDFLAGRYRFQQANETGAAVLNQGEIRVNQGGFAVLTGPLVGNEGRIVARAGRVELLSGRSATLDFDGRDLVLVQVAGELGEGDVVLPPGGMSEALSQALGVTSANRADRMVALPDGRVLLRSSSPQALNLGAVEQGLLHQNPDPGTDFDPDQEFEPTQEPFQEEGERIVVTITVEGVPRHGELFKDPSIFAQDDTYMVEDELEELQRPLRPAADEDTLSPTLEPWNDDNFLRKKFRESR